MQTSDVWNGAEAIVVAVGASSEELRYHKSIALQVWLYGYELPGKFKIYAKSVQFVVMCIVDVVCGTVMQTQSCCSPKKLYMFSQAPRKVITCFCAVKIILLLPNVRHSLSLTLHKPTHAAALLHELVGPAQNDADVKLEFFERAKGDDGSAHIQKMIDVMKGANGSVGALPKVAALPLSIMM